MPNPVPTWEEPCAVCGVVRWTNQDANGPCDCGVARAGQASTKEQLTELAADLNERLSNCFTFWEWQDDAGAWHYCYSEDCPFEYVPGAPMGGHGSHPLEHMIPERRSDTPLHALAAATYDPDEPNGPLERLLAATNPEGGEGNG